MQRRRNGTGLRVLVCGGRTWGWCRNDASPAEFRRVKKERRITFDVLDAIDAEVKISVIIQGEARGADATAKRWAESRGKHIDPYPADWTRHGKAAGPIRNSLMLKEGTPDIVLAFPGGVGTADMVSKAVDDDGVVVLDAKDIGGSEDSSGLFGAWRGCRAR